MSAIIKVENLSKRFIISHEQREGYTSLRDVVTRKVKKTFSFGAKRGVPSSTREEFWALKDLNFTINQGDRVGIIGRNGAGKSTLLKILSRITEPTTGRVTIDGRVASLLEVGTGFHPELTGRENIFLNGAILGMGRAEIRKKFDEIVAFAEVEKFLDTPVKRYSSGMYVRLAFAVAAHLEPEILIVDEVLAVGDAQFQQKCLGKMEEVSKGGRTVLFVSHQIPSLLQLCTNGILLIGGQINFAGKINDVVNKYILGNDQQNIYKPLQPKENGFEEISVMNIRDQISEAYRFDEEIKVNYALNISSFQRNMTLGLMVLDSKHNPVFIDEYALDEEKINKGKYMVTALLPSKFLMPGEYIVNTGFHNPNISVFDECYNLLTFRIDDTGSNLSKYRGQFLGVVFKDLIWKS